MSKLIFSFSLLFFISNLSCFLTYLNLKKLKSLDLYVYYVPEKDVIVCTNKLIPENKLELDEIETKEGFVCLLPKEENGEYLNVLLHLSKTKGSSNNHTEMKEKKFVNLKIRDSKVLSEIDLFDEYYNENPYEKNVLLKIQNDEISYSIENPVNEKIKTEMFNKF